MSLIDTALARRQSFGPGWDVETMARLRERVELGIYDLLEEQVVLTMGDQIRSGELPV